MKLLLGLLLSIATLEGLVKLANKTDKFRESFVDVGALLVAHFNVSRVLSAVLGEEIAFFSRNHALSGHIGVSSNDHVRSRGIVIVTLDLLEEGFGILKGSTRAHVVDEQEAIGASEPSGAESSVLILTGSIQDIGQCNASIDLPLAAVDVLNSRIVDLAVVGVHKLNDERRLASAASAKDREASRQITRSRVRHRCVVLRLSSM